MLISDELIQKLKVILYEDYSLELSDEAVEGLAQDLINLFGLLLDNNQSNDQLQ